MSFQTEQAESRSGRCTVSGTGYGTLLKFFEYFVPVPSDNMTKRAKEYMNADFVYEDYKNLAEAQKIADVEDVTAISERLIKQNMEAYKELAK